MISISRTRMLEEIKTDNNCIVKAFENNPISILEEDLDNKRVYYFKASDIGKVLDIVNIRTSIVNFDEDEKVVRTTYSSNSGNQDTIFLTSRGVYRLLYSSKKEIAKKFRKWASDILDDIIFNQSRELQRQLEERKHLLEIKDNEIKTCKKESFLHKQSILLKEYNSQINIVYIIRVKSLENNNYIIKVGESRMGIVNRFNEHKSKYPECLLLDVFSVKRSNDFEKFLHKKLYAHKYNKLNGHGNENELFLVGEKLSYDTIITLVKENINDFNDDHLQVRKLELEIQKLKLENERKLTIENELLNKIDKLQDNVNNLYFFIENEFSNMKIQNNLKLTNNFGEKSCNIGQKVQQINPETLSLVKVYQNIAEVSKTLRIPRSSLTKAIKDCTVYKNYRWAFLEDGISENIVAIKETKKLTKNQNLGYIAKLNKKKDVILAVYLDRQTASRLNNYKSICYLDNYVKSGKIVDNCYYVLYDSLSQDLKNNFLKKINKDEVVLFKNNGIGKFDLYGNLIKEFRSKLDCTNSSEIGNKSLIKALTLNLPYKNYYYKYADSKLYISF
jgi:prophage antirepressor-like protein